MKKKRITQSKVKEVLSPEEKEERRKKKRQERDQRKKEEREKKEGKKKLGRPTLLTPELRATLIRLFEENFFIGIVAASADIYRARIEEWENEDEKFRIDVTHARDQWIKQQMILLDLYAIDKKTKDWRALKYKLSIADAEYNDKKYLREEISKQNISRLTIIINQKDLETSKKEAIQIIGEVKAQEEIVSLIPFRKEKKDKEEKKGKPGEAET